MVYIFAAIYAEARHLIKHYDLKLQKRERDLKFDVFANEHIRLVITGSGAINAAMAVGNVATLYSMTDTDEVINIGSCAMMGKNTGKVFIINKIIDYATQRTFYPDMLIKNDMPEGQIITVPKPLNDIKEFNSKINDKCENETDDSGKTNIVYDMEASAIYQAATYFVGPDRVSFIKAVSDSGERITAADISDVMEKVQSQICRYIDDKLFVSENMAASDTSGTKLLEQTIYQTAEAMKCSKVMTDQLSQLLHYCYLAEIDYASVIDELYSRELLPCSSKKEGKLCLEEFKKRLL